jgi:ubiquinone/menaquinone biosynthesis C-methylase UbiE
MASNIEITAKKWSDYTANFSGRNAGLFWWEAGPEIGMYINGKISGRIDTDWVAHTLDKYFGGRLPLDRCLSLGCGDGHLECRLAQLSTFQHCDAYDVAEGSLQEARRLAEKNGINSISYYTSDINKIILPAGMYDSVWIDGAMHHFEALEHICQQISQSLKPEGLLILNEYIGPNRLQCSIRQQEITNLCLKLLPARYRKLQQVPISFDIEHTPFRKGAIWFISRLIDKLRNGDLIGAIRRRFLADKASTSNQSTEKTTVIFPSRRHMITIDPSEAVRSEEIVEVLQRDFDIIEKKDYGINVLQFLLYGIAWNFSTEDQISQDLLKMLINIEDTLLQCGEFKSDFAYIVARPKQGAG